MSKKNRIESFKKNNRDQKEGYQQLQLKIDDAVKCQKSGGKWDLMGFEKSQNFVLSTFFKLKKKRYQLQVLENVSKPSMK